MPNEWKTGGAGRLLNEYRPTSEYTYMTPNELAKASTRPAMVPPVPCAPATRDGKRA